MLQTKVSLKTKLKKNRSPITKSHLIKKISAEQLRNRRELDEYGDKLIREHKDEFVDIDDI